MKYLILFATLLLGACSTTPNDKLTQTMLLIAQSEAQAPDGVSGTFQFQIKASAMVKGEVFLNTELDYRDRRAISIAIDPDIVPAFTAEYGTAPDTFFVDKNIEVKGEAKRAKIFLISRGRLTNKYYFQTHIRVTSLEQITLLN